MKVSLIMLSLVGCLAAGTLPSEQRRNGPLLREVLSPVQKAFQESSAVFYDLKTRKYFIYGTVMSADGYILTKSSELPEAGEFSVRIGKEHYREAEVVGRDAHWDLALVKVNAEGLLPPVWKGKDGEGEIQRATWVVSNGATARRSRRVRPGVISANRRPIEGPTLTALGLALSEEGEEVIIGGVAENSGAKEAELEEKDVILAVDGQTIKNREDLLQILESKVPGDQVLLRIRRGDQELEKEVELKARGEVFEEQLDRNDQMSGEFSRRRTNFPMVIQHDTTSSRRNMGGPLLLLDGTAVGMNIACANRVETYAIPAKELLEVYQRMLKAAQ